LRQILDTHPGLEGMRDPLPHFSPERRQLDPEDPPTEGESPFVLLDTYTEDPFGEYHWSNKPADTMAHRDFGYGFGFEKITSTPIITEPRKRPRRRPDLFEYSGWHVASRGFVELVSRFDAPAVTALPIEWRFRGETSEDYFFFDITRLVDAYDYRRSKLDVYFQDGKRWLYDILYPRTLKRGAGEGHHVFRDYYRRRDILMSLELAKALVDAGMRGIRFKNLVTGRELELDHVEYRE
jgi:hypothetical protein